MTRKLSVVLLMVLAAGFMVGLFTSTTQAKDVNCWTYCGPGDVLWECCDIVKHGCVVGVRCGTVDPEAPC